MHYSRTRYQLLLILKLSTIEQIAKMLYLWGYSARFETGYLDPWKVLGSMGEQILQKGKTNPNACKEMQPCIEIKEPKKLSNLIKQ